MSQKTPSNYSNYLPQLTPMYESEIGLDGNPTKVLKVYGVAVVCDKVGINNRLYTSELIGREAVRFTNERIKQFRSSAELNHPRIDEKGQGKDGSIFVINLLKVCALIEKLELNGKNLDIVYRVTKSRNGLLTTPGDILANLIDNGMKPGCSLRGAGSAMKRNGYEEVSPDYRLITVDIVGNPSFDVDAMLDIAYESASKSPILLESVGNESQIAILENATAQFRHTMANYSAWSNSYEAKADVLASYFESAFTALKGKQ